MRSPTNDDEAGLKCSAERRRSPRQVTRLIAGNHVPGPLYGILNAQNSTEQKSAHRFATDVGNDYLPFSFMASKGDYAFCLFTGLKQYR